MKNKSVVIFALVSAIAIFVAATLAYNKVKSDKKEELAVTDPNAVPYVREHSMSLGKNEKNITVVEFLDPECESCAMFSSVVNKVLYDYGDEIKFVVRYLPNHRNSAYVVRILEAARVQGKYKETLQAVFDSQPQWANHNNPQLHLIWSALVNVDGLNLEQLKADMNNDTCETIMQLDIEDANTLGVRGTPTIFVNGKELETLSYPAFKMLLENEIYK
ncbi:DsbA family protein [Candidatus Marinarcus aquaticus]|uniref:Disulfide bond formation protein DsbA n=1 Tax=Candidatus Marinarcus aquaticus TaxID=2044504 RepID=A0A4Q0XTP9_9BACT|nr:thioredoxin domain-containing protein [Candidatus Marinarcus aquaticus]RXJ60806.1 disulfide bond formation protein DsbA [Candidatus Marinarcus aquaticus]